MALVAETPLVIAIAEGRIVVASVSALPG